jgi:hypothetical protein
MGQDTWQDHMTNRESHDRQEQGTRQNHKTPCIWSDKGNVIEYIY